MCIRDRYITFRGSNSLKDWKVDLTFFKTCIPYDGCNPKLRVHSGFLDVYKRQVHGGSSLKIEW